MFDALLARLSLRRSAAGIYFELRTLRQMAEIYFDAAGLELPRERRRKFSSTIDEVPVDGSMTEEQMAARERDRINKDRALGRDSGTEWREDPNR
jgi:hypothetical protein